MKEPEYIEGQQATENFEEGMKALFKVAKEGFTKIRPKKRTPKPASVRKTKRSDED